MYALMCDLLPGEEVVLLTLRHVVRAGSGKAVIQQHKETKKQ